MDLAPHDTLARYDYGLVLTLQGKHPEAAIQINESLRLKPDFADAYLRRGGTYEDMGDYDRAIAD